ncbi:MAG: hypothetical protein IJ723_03360 [Ruminococcus sp.]|nr:hypothetical protein [Ruminococcus sp.]
MKYPRLVPDRVCTTPITVYREGGLNRDGSPKRTIIFEGRCNYSEKTYQRITADKQLVTLNAAALFNGDIAPESDTIEGEVLVLHGIHRRIYASQKCRDPDGTVNYTRLELI